jgi:8-oxo-dGTP pyrophosphatase MutT (NUDIX family)
MNDVIEAKPQAVRARDAASLILLRGAGRDLELLVGRRPLDVRFMPGVYVFPGGAVDAEDARPWQTEIDEGFFPPQLMRCARAALRETWEEVGVLVGRRAEQTSQSPASGATGVEAAYAAAGIAAAIDTLSYVGRAITPTRVFRRFNTRFFLADGSNVFGEPASSEELEDVGWHPIGRQPLAALRDVSEFMLARAVALRAGTAAPEAPLFCTAGGKRRILLCREAIRDV